MMADILARIALFLAIAAVLVVSDLLLRSHVIRAIRGLVHLGRRALSRGAHYSLLGCSRYGRRALWRGAHYLLRGCTRYGPRVCAFAEDLVIVWPPRVGYSPELADRIVSRQGLAPAAETQPNLNELGEDGGVS